VGPDSFEVNHEEVQKTSHRFLRPILPFFAVIALAPVSPNYTLESYEFGSGGVTQSSQYEVQATPSASDTTSAASTTYQLGTGLVPVEQAFVPPAPTLANASHDYDRLSLTLAAGDNPSDAEFLVSISTDGFSTDTRYVQSANTIGASQDWRTLADWGGGSGVTITGLASAKTYTVKVKARHGDFTESGFGPTASTDTEAPTLTLGNNFATSNTLTVQPETEDTVAGTITVQTNADSYTVKTYADNGGGAANPRNATSGDVIPNANGFSPVDTNTETSFTSGSGFGYRIDSVTGSEVAAFSAQAFKSFAYGTQASHGSAVAALKRIATRPAWATDQATITLKVRSDWNVPAAANYQTTVYFDVTPTYDGL